MSVETVDERGEVPEFHGPVSTYEVVAEKPNASDTRFVASDLYDDEDVRAEALERQAEINSQPAQLAERRPVKKKRKSAQQERELTKMYVVLAAGLGVLASLAVVAFVLVPRTPAQNSYDMGTVTSTTTGLKGHLITDWTNRLKYKLTIEPSDSGQLDAFITAINNPPQPLSVTLQLRDVSGTVLCDTPILLRYDPLKNAPDFVPDDSSSPAPNTREAAIEEAIRNQAQIDQSLNNARMVSQELAREHGNEVFQTVTGRDGQIASLSAQGTMPCTKKQYESAASWAFTTNFPSILLPTGPGSYDSDLSPFGAAGEGGSDSFGGRKVKQKVPRPASHFSVEQDDELVSYHASTGLAETREGKTFLVEKRDMVASSLKGVEFPIPIHYRCDQFGACSLFGLHRGIQHAWLEH